MLFSKIRWRIAIPAIVLVGLVLGVVAVFVVDFIEDTYHANLENKLLSEARLTAEVLDDLLVQDAGSASYGPVVKHYAALLDARVTVMDETGLVLGDSLEDPAAMDNHLYRPEVQQAFRDGTGSAVRFSRTMGYDMMYGAVRVQAADETVGCVRVALPLSEVDAAVRQLRRYVLSVTGAAIVLAWLFAIWVAERTARPVRNLTEAAHRVAHGDLSTYLLPTTRDEVGALTRSFNEMIGALRKTIESLERERSRLAGVLENMADGVLITDGEGSVSMINPAACRIFGMDREQAMDLSFAQVSRDHRMINLWRECYELREERIDVIEMSREGPLLQAVITPLQGAEGRSCLVVLQDLTRTRQLETMRRDLISNVSHELRTPLASLKALTETLRDSALDDPPAARRFLDRIENEVDAMTQMAREFLELSRIDSGRVPIRLVPTSVFDLVVPPVDRLLPQADRAGIELTMDLPQALPLVLADGERIQQVVTNIVHNAIKFTLPGGTVCVSGKVGDQEVVLTVRDTGVGIPSDDLPRIFERFFKSDRARSGGGTGLGLSIARHIVLAHGGRIWAESVEGEGATFHFTLLRANGHCHAEV